MTRTRFFLFTSQKNSFPLKPQNHEIHDTSSELLIFLKNKVNLTKHTECNHGGCKEQHSETHSQISYIQSSTFKKHYLQSFKHSRKGTRNVFLLQTQIISTRFKQKLPFCTLISHAYATSSTRKGNRSLRHLLNDYEKREYSKNLK